MQMTRRLFLQVTGGGMLTGGLLPGGFPALERLPLAGRVLRQTPVCQGVESPVIMRNLWPDSTVPLEGAVGDWYRVRDGVVAKRDLQPMLPYDPAGVTVPDALPGVMTVVAPAAPVRAWAAGDAPLVARVGYGGAGLVLDALPDGESGWYAIRDETAPGGAVLGWTPAARWSVPGVAPVTRIPEEARLVLDSRRAEARLMHDGRVLARFPAAVAPAQRAGQYRLTHKRPCGPVGKQVGASWLLDWPGGVLYGAHWHHDLGGPGLDEGWGVAPWAARWLYESLPVGTAINVV
ncbi:MAG: L,D-transpeptidase [Anaerolineae bacterium]|nr:L,D-transpeptidase [Anaerolineae bacterium]